MKPKKILCLTNNKESELLSVQLDSYSIDFIYFKDKTVTNRGIIDTIAYYDAVVIAFDLPENNYNEDVFYETADSLKASIDRLIKNKSCKNIPVIAVRFAGYNTHLDKFTGLMYKNKIDAIVTAWKVLESSLKELLNYPSKFDNTIIFKHLNHYYNEITDVKDKINFLIKFVGERNELLVDEETLAIRLGVNKDKSGKAWEELKSILKDFEYKGIFKEDFCKWWYRGIEAMFAEKDSDINDLGFQGLTIMERNRFLSYFGFKDLVPLNENKDAYDYYKCALSDNTMDKNDCITLFSSFGDTPWTEEKRVSIDFIVSCKDINVLENLYEQTGSTAYILEYYIRELKNNAKL